MVILFIITCFLLYILDCEEIHKFISNKQFGRKGHRIFMEDGPSNTYNTMMAKVCLTLWEMVDCLNIIGVPKDPQKPLQLNTWCLTDFVQNKVSASSTNLTAFLYCSSD